MKLIGVIGGGLPPRQWFGLDRHDRVMQTEVTWVLTPQKC